MIKTFPPFTPEAVPAVGCSLYLAANINSNTGAYAVIPWDGEEFDTNGFHAGSSSDIVIPSGYAGKYLISAVALMQQATAGYRAIAIRKNGTAVAQAQDLIANTNGYTSFRITDSFALAAGETISIAVYQNSGGNLIISGPSGSIRQTFMSLIRLGS